MKESIVRQFMGIALIIVMVLVNLVLSIACVNAGNCAVLDNFGWGFLNGMLIVFGIIMTGG